MEPLACGRDAADVWERRGRDARRARADLPTAVGAPTTTPARRAGRPAGSRAAAARRRCWTRSGAVVADLRPHQLLDIGPGRPAGPGRRVGVAARRRHHGRAAGAALPGRAARAHPDEGAPRSRSDDGHGPVRRRPRLGDRRVRQMIISAGDRTLGDAGLRGRHPRGGPVGGPMNGARLHVSTWPSPGSPPAAPARCRASRRCSEDARQALRGLAADRLPANRCRRAAQGRRRHRGRPGGGDQVTVGVRLRTPCAGSPRRCGAGGRGRGGDHLTARVHVTIADIALPADRARPPRTRTCPDHPADMQCSANCRSLPNRELHLGAERARPTWGRRVNGAMVRTQSPQVPRRAPARRAAGPAPERPLGVGSASSSRSSRPVAPSGSGRAAQVPGQRAEQGEERGRSARRIASITRAAPAIAETTLPRSTRSDTDTQAVTAAYEGSRWVPASSRASRSAAPSGS
ncbi:hypothetical protein HBB16_05960 [Pseudonocardia sp. MCCB 268]|nr:hypothetical protein [Pseudonocardia cytotoxica]